jgi:hypothetical protein
VTEQGVIPLRGETWKLVLGRLRDGVSDDDDPAAVKFALDLGEFIRSAPEPDIPDGITERSLAHILLAGVIRLAAAVNPSGGLVLLVCWLPTVGAQWRPFRELPCEWLELTPDEWAVYARTAEIDDNVHVVVPDELPEGW